MNNRCKPGPGLRTAILAIAASLCASAATAQSDRFPAGPANLFQPGAAFAF
jgi:hypothetical protein